MGSGSIVRVVASSSSRTPTAATTGGGGAPAAAAVDEHLVKTVQEFDTLVQKKKNFRENQVRYFGASVSPAADPGDCKGGGGERGGGGGDGRQMQMQEQLQLEHPMCTLSNMCLVPSGIKYSVNGTVCEFDTSMHLYCFLVHGVPTNISKWTKGGVMSDFVAAFGVEQGTTMRMKHGNMIGLIPHLLVQLNRSQKRAEHGIVLRTVVVRDEESTHYAFWRPILHAKFAEEPQRFHLLNTGNKYLMDRDGTPLSTMKQADLRDKGQQSERGLLTFSDVIKKSQDYAQLRRDGARVGGALEGTNRMGKFIMAIRSEIRLLLVGQSAPAPAEPVDVLAAAAVKKSTKRKRPFSPVETF